MSQDPAASASVPTGDDALPAPLTLSALLSQVSFEHRNGTLGLIATDEQKRHIQQMIKTQTNDSNTATAVSSSTSSSSSSSSSSSTNNLLPPSLFSNGPAGPSLSFAGLPPFAAAGGPDAGDADHASELAPTPLFRALSDAAALGLISHAVKSEIKGLLLNNRINCLSTNRMVRQVSAAGEVSMVEVKLDLSKIDEDECARFQEEEREALEAIYADDVKFAITAHQLDENAEEEIKADEEGEEAQEEEEEKDGSSSLSIDDENVDPNSRACITVNVLIKPYPASGDDRNLVSTRVRFTLPPLYPFIRPSFHIVSIEGMMDESEGMMMGTVMNEKLNELFQVEPVPADSARVVLFDLIQAAEAFLQEYMDFLDDKAYQAQLQQEKEESEKILKARLKAQLDAQQAKEAEIKHAQAAYAYMTSDHKKLEFSSTGSVLSAQHAEFIKRQEEERKKKEQERIEAERIREKAIKDAEEALKNMSKSQSLVIPAGEDVVASIKATDRHFPPSYIQAFYQGDLFFESIVSPFLRYRFIKARAAMRAAQRIDDISIGYHGTVAHAVDSIRQKGLAVPGETMADGTSIGHRCDVGYFGRGVYLSPNLSYSLGYGSWNTMFVCLVLRGKSYCAEYSLGRGLESGFDSHHDPSGNEWIIFNSACILPIYLIKGTAAYAPAPAYVPPPAPVAKKHVPVKHATKPPASSKSAKILLAKIQKEKTDKSFKQGPVSSVPKKKK